MRANFLSLSVFHFSFLLLTAVVRQPAFSQTDFRIEKYNTLNGLTKDHWVNGVQVDTAGMVWLTLRRGGLARFDGEAFTRHPLPDAWETNSTETIVQGFKIDGRGKFWVYALNKLAFFDPVSGQYEMPPEIGGIPNERVDGVFCTRHGEIVFIAKGKIYQINKGSDSLQFVLVGNMAGSPEGCDLEAGDHGDVWQLCREGYYRFQPGNPAPAFFGFQKTEGNPFPPIRPPFGKLYDSPPGSLWHTDRQGSLHKLDGDGNVVENYAMKEFDYLYSIYESNDIKWFGTFDGLIKVSHRSYRFQTWLDQPFDMASGAVTGISCYGIAESSDGTIYTTTNENNLMQIFPNEPGKVRSIPPSLKDIRRYGLMTDRRGSIWFSRYYDNVVDVLVPETNVIRRVKYDDALGISNSLLENKDGIVWVACENGIALIDPATDRAGIFPLPEKTFVWHLHQSDDGAVWAATKNGILKIPAGSDRMPQSKPLQPQLFNPSNTPGMKTGEILSIHEAEGFLWCGSADGLVRFDPKTGKAFTFTTRHGLPNDYVYAAIPAEGFLWLPTNKGLARVSLASAKQDDVELLDVASFGTDEGLPHHEFNTLTFLKAKNGKIWLGGLNGIACFDPRDLLPQPSEDKNVLIAEFSKYDQEADSLLSFPIYKISPGEPFILRPQEKFFTARFALLDYRNPKANQYSYKLEGFDPVWIFAGNQSTLRYANLPPGKYTLRIRGANPNGTWSSREASATIIVQQVWYKTAWAWAAYLLLAAGLGYLAWRVRLRQLRLAHEFEMEHARAKDLQELEEFKSRFFTNITHEFRTPLTVILGMTERLAASGGVTSSPPLTLIKRNGHNLLRLINQILDLAKLESNTLKINYVQGDVLPYLRYVAESLHSLANAQNVMLRVESSEAQIVMDYDPERLLQIVFNLLSNAIKFTPDGGRVTLRAGTDLAGFQNLPSLNLAVNDTGVGIPAEDLPKIFDRFYQVDSAVSSSRANSTANGTGIGLSLTKELVKAMGGEISVESEVDRGTTFTVRLPITRNAPVGATLAVAPVLPQEQGRPQGSPLRTSENGGEQPVILIVEDNPDVVEYLAACLQGSGDREGRPYQLDFAYNGRAGIEKAFETIPDLIISDVMMPEKDGFEVCDFLKNDERTSHIPIVLLTAKADVESRIAGLKRGADAYLSKPFHQEELLVTLANLLELRRKLQAKYREVASTPTHAQLSESFPKSPTSDPENEFLKKLRLAVEARLGDADLSSEDICRVVGMGKSNLYAKLSALTGLSFNLFVRKLRLGKAKELLSTSQMNVSEVAYEVGFNDPKFFSRVFSEEFGAPPSAFLKS